jgi:hypothetical protein
MIKYVENRVWCLNARVVQTGLPEQIREQLTRESDKLFGQEGSVHIDITRNDLDHYTDNPTVVQVDLKEPAIRFFHKRVLERTDYFRPISVQMNILDLGFLNVTAAFDICGEFGLQKAEFEGMKISEALSELYPQIEGLLDLLATKAVIRKSELYHFGVPSLLGGLDLHTYEDSFLYNQHLLFVDEPDVLSSTIVGLGPMHRSFSYQGYRVYSTWGLYLWDVPTSVTDKKDISHLLAIDTLALAESVTYDNATSCYTALIELAGQRSNIDSKNLRVIFNFNNMILQRLRLWKRNLSVQEADYLKDFSEQANFKEKFALFKNAEEALKFAIEGIEASKAEEANKTIQLLLAFFTALTLYSVTTDIYSFLTGHELDFTRYHLFSLKTIILLSVTGLVCAFMAYLKRRT